MPGQSSESTGTPPRDLRGGEPGDLAGFAPSGALHPAGEAVKVGPFSVSQALASRELGVMPQRRTEARLKSTYRTAQPWRLACQEYTAAQRSVDKAFCSAWIGPDHVLVGTKCNTLLHLSFLTGAARRVPLPPKPAVRRGPGLMANADGHAGMHALDVSPDGRLVVCGGAAAEDAVVLRAHDLSPVQTFSGHADWVFGLAWVTDRHFVSCSRDGTAKLWCVNDSGEGGGYNEETAGPLASVLENKRTVVRQRDVKCWAPAGRVTTLGGDGTVATWDAALRLSRKVVLEGAKELTSMATQEHLVAVGSSTHMHLLDMRQRCTAVGLVPVTDNSVRSLAIEGHLLSAGTGDASLVIFDLRYLRRAKGPRLRDLTAESDPFDAVRGHQPLELGMLQMPPSANNVQDLWGWVVRDAVYSHKWDPSGTRLFVAGGPLAVGMSGCSLSGWV